MPDWEDFVRATAGLPQQEQEAMYQQWQAEQSAAPGPTIFDGAPAYSPAPAPETAWSAPRPEDIQALRALASPGGMSERPPVPDAAGGLMLPDGSAVSAPPPQVPAPPPIDGSDGGFGQQQAAATAGPPGPVPTARQAASAATAAEYVDRQNFINAMAGPPRSGGPRRTRVETRTTYGTTPEERARVEGSRQEVQSAQRQQSDTLHSQSVDRLIEAERISLQREELELERDRVAKERETEARAVQLRVDEARSLLERRVREAASMTIDADRVYERAGTGGRIAMAIGVALGAFGSSLDGGPNQAYQILQDMVQQDIEEQRANMGQANRSAEEARGTYTLVMDEMGDHEAATRAQMADYYSRAASLADRMSRQSDRSEELQQMAQALQTQSMQEQEAYNLRTVGVMQEEVRRVSGGGGNAAARQQAAAFYDSRYGENLEAMAGGGSESDLPGMVRLPNAGPATAAMRSQVVGYRRDTSNLRRNLQELRRLNNQLRGLRRGALQVTHGGQADADGILPQMYRGLDSEGAQLVERMNELYVSIQSDIKGIPSDRDARRIEGALPNPVALFSQADDVDSRLSDLVVRLDDAIARDLAYYGYAEVDGGSSASGPSSYRQGGQ